MYQLKLKFNINEDVKINLFRNQKSFIDSTRFF